MTQRENQWHDIYKYYNGCLESVEVLDIFTREKYTLSTRELIEFRPESPDFILSIPHSGVLLPTQYKDHFELNSKSLIEIDFFSDIIFEPTGGLQVISRLTPLFINMNRPREGSRSEYLPRHLTNSSTEYYSIDDELILQKSYAPLEKESILQYYDLYHGLLSSLIEYQKRNMGYALLIDGHSMTSVGLGRAHDKGQERDNFVVGTLDDTSAHPAIISAFVETLRQGIGHHGLGLTVSKNDPYSGGFITRIHGNPGRDAHAIQIEVTMGTYMYEPVEKDRVKRFALKQHRVHVVQDILSQAITSACDAAGRIYSQ